MCLFHKWEEENSGTASQEIEYHNGRVYERKVKVVIEKCSKCHKRKSYFVNQVGTVRSIALWAAEDILNNQ